MTDTIRIAVTGHMNLTAETEDLVAAEIRRRLPTDKELVGISCLAKGADTIFAEAVVERGGRLEIVLPSSDYRARKVKPDHAPTFDRLVGVASKVQTMPFVEANRDAYEAANEAVLSSCDVLFAVWDGEAPVDQGGTAAVVEQATASQLPVERIWPAGASRTR